MVLIDMEKPATCMDCVMLGAYHMHTCDIPYCRAVIKGPRIERVDAAPPAWCPIKEVQE